MPYWVMKARLEHALRELAMMHGNLLPRLRLLAEQLGRAGDVVEMWEVMSMLTYFDKKLRVAYGEIEHDCKTIQQLTMGLPAVRTTPLIYATEDESYTS